MDCFPIYKSPPFWVLGWHHRVMSPHHRVMSPQMGGFVSTISERYCSICYGPYCSACYGQYPQWVAAAQIVPLVPSPIHQILAGVSFLYPKWLLLSHPSVPWQCPNHLLTFQSSWLQPFSIFMSYLALLISITSHKVSKKFSPSNLVFALSPFLGWMGHPSTKSPECWGII
jgi:hypothetical protein